MFGIPGSTLLESSVLSPGSFGVLDKATSILGLNAANAPIILMLGDVKFSLNTAVMSEVSRTTEATWAEAERIGALNTLQHTGPGRDTLEIPGTIFPDWKGAAGTLDTLRQMQRTGEVYFLMASNGDVLGLFVISAIKETRSLYKSNGDPRKVTFTLSLRRYMELAAQKPTPQHDGLLGGVKKFAHALEDGVSGLENDAMNALGDVTGEVGSALDDATGGITDALNSGADRLTKGLKDL